MADIQSSSRGAATSLQALIKRYRWQHRGALWQLTARSAALRDLLASFPAAAVAIAALPADDPMRVAATRCVEAGAPLGDVARALQLPLWSRRLPPEALGAPPPSLAADERAEERFGARVLNLIPERPTAMAVWLETVTAARVAGGDDFAVWVGAQKVLHAHRPNRLPVQALALYAWHSQNTGALAPMPASDHWHPGMSLARAASATRAWLLDVLQERCICDLPAGDRRKAVRVDEYDFVPLVQAAEIGKEARAMHNCLRQYVGAVAWRHCRLYGIRRDGRRLATIEVGLAEASRLPYVRQLRGPHNAGAPPELVHAAMTWLERERDNLKRELALDFDQRSEALFAQQVWRPCASALGRDREPAPAIGDILRDLDRLGAFAK